MENLTQFWESYGELTVIIVACALALVLLIFAFVNHKKGKFNSKLITHGAIAIALSMVLNLVTIYSMPNGGSVTLGRLIPLLMFAYIYGFPAGCIIGGMYGLLDFMMKPYFLNIIQFLLDYPLAFAGVGFAGLSIFKNVKFQKLSFILGIVITGLSRWLFSSVSGTLYWGMPFAGAVAYNSVLLIDTAVCIVIIAMMLSSKSFVNLIDSEKSKVRRRLTVHSAQNE